MPITLNSLDVVVVGRFNPYIIQPSWLRKMGICQTDEAHVELRFNMATGRSDSHFEMDGYRWHVTNSRLMVAAESPTRSPVTPVCRVIENLPHTPVSAVGHNFRYRCDVEIWKGVLPKIGDLDYEGIRKFGKPRQLSSSCALEVDDLVFNMKLEQDDSSLTIHTNLHREASETSDVLALVQKFCDDLDSSKRLIELITNEQVERNDNDL